MFDSDKIDKIVIMNAAYIKKIVNQQIIRIYKKNDKVKKVKFAY